MCKPVTAVLAALLAAAPPLAAQAETPEQVAQQFMASANALDWGRTATLMHPIALQQLRELLAPALSFQGAEGDQVRQQLFEFGSREAAMAASDSAIFVSLMRFTTRQQPELESILQTSRYQYLGAVPEGRDTVHVLGRVSMTVKGAAINQMEVMSMMRAGPTWRALLKGDFAQLAGAIRSAMEQAEQQQQQQGTEQ